MGFGSHPDYAGGVPVAKGNTAYRAQQGLPLLGNQENRSIGGCRAYSDQFVTVRNLHRQQPGRAQVAQLAGAQSVYASASGGKDIEMAVFAAASRQHSLHQFAGLQIDQVHQQYTATGAAGVVGRFVDIEGVNAPLVGEKQQLIVGVDHLQLHQGIVVAVAGAAHALATTLLIPVGADGHTLDVSALAQGNNDIFLDDELLDGLLLEFGQFNDRAARVGVFTLEFASFPLDLRPNLLRVLQQIFQLGDGGEQVVVFFVQTLPFQCGQPAQLHVQDGLCLNLGEVELLHQVVAGRLHVLAVADRLDDGVDGVERLQQAFNDMRAIPRPPQLVLGAATDHVFPVGDEVGDEILE